MPPSLLIDIDKLDLSQIIFGPEGIRECNPQRGDMEHVDGIIWADAEHGKILGFKDVRPDEFWVPGHIPGRPLLPGVIMIEAAAQLSCFYAKAFLKWEGFIGFGGVEECKFRLAVSPGERLYLLGVQTWIRHKRIGSRVQGVVNGNIVFECEVIGTKM